MNKNVLTVISAVSLSFMSSAFAADAAFRVTPYVQHPATNAITLKFLSDAEVPATVSWWPQGNTGAAQSATVSPRLAEELQYYGDSHAKQYLPEMTPWQYRHRIEGLQPDTVYEYRVELAGGASYAKHFRTAPAAFRPIRFVAYSDSETEPASNGSAVTWDNYAQDQDTNPSATSRKYLVDQTVGYASNICTMVSRQPDFFVIAGDLVQTGSSQTHWDEFWRHNAGALNDPAGSIPILAALGNHEYSSYTANVNGTVQPGEQGALKFLSYFEFEPNGTAVLADQQQRFHRVDYGPVAMIFIDPNNGPDNEPPAGTSWSWAWEYSHPHPLDTNAQLYEHRIDGGIDKSSRVPQFQEGSEQYRWLEEQLADAQTNKLFTFLVCHQCPFSAGYHGRASGELGRGGEDENLSGVPTRCLTNLVFKYGVDGWICGHDEMYEHSQVQGEETLPDGTKRPMTLNVWDVGIGGDGLRGCRITEEPNPYEVFRAHVDSPEVYDNGDWQTGTLVSGGKHYGHLEVNVDQNADGLWTATLTPVYNFVSKNAQTGALTFERRTYPDEVVVTNLDYHAESPSPQAPVWVNAAATPTAPYATAGTGFTTLSDAVAYVKGLETDDAKVIKVKNGTYGDSGITLDFPVRIEGDCDEGTTASFNNTSGTTLTVDHEGAIVKGLAFNGHENNGVTLKAGVVAECTFRNWTKAATGILIVNGGEARGCLFTGNYATGGGYAGASAYVKGGVMTNCVFRNESGMTTEVFVQNGLFTDSIITNCNTGVNSGHGNLGCNAMVINGTGTARRILVAHCGSTTITHQGGGTNFGKSGRQPGIVTVAAGTLADSLIYDNSARDYPGVSVYNGGRVVNCTIGAIRSVGKDASGTGLNLLQYGGEVVNTIIYGDILQSDAGYAKSGGTVTHSLFMNAAHDDGASGNIVGKEPLFNGTADGDYTLSKFSPCRDAGMADAAVSADAPDLAYAPRVQNGVVDMGCYELTPFGPEDVDVRIELADYVVNDDYSQTTTLKATLFGGATEGFSYEWTDGDTVLGTGESVTVTTQPGIRLVGVTCRKGDIVRTDSYRIAVYPKTMYVSPDGTGEAPYATMETAMKTLDDVLVVMQDAGDLYHEFVLSNCTYAVSTELVFTYAGKVRSADGGRAKIDLKSGAGFFRVGSDVTFENLDFVNGKSAIAISAGKMLGCTLKGMSISGGMTGLKISGSAVVDDITVSEYSGGWSNQKSVHQTGGELRNAKIVNCGYVDSALTVDNGLCSNLVITGTWHNHGYDNRLPSNALTINGGLVTHAVITNNGDNVRIYQGTVRVLGGTLRNAYLADNACPDTAGVYVSGQGRVENCTVFANVAAGGNKQGDALRQVGGTVVNSAFFSSFAAEGQPGAVQTGGTMSYSRTDEPIAGERNTTDPVRFVTLDGWAYVPSGKPLVGGGVLLDWMAGTTDLRGQPRLFGAKPDIGCFESPFQSGLKVLLK